MSDGGGLPPGPWVVKFGGSLHGAPELREWLRAVAGLPRAAVAVVPGGGPFADAVRRAQERVGFGDLAAHRMAILAMQQFGLLLQEIEPRLRLAETEGELLAGGAAVWLPWRLAGLEERIEAGWDLTSDSLALWLARRLGAAALVLVKSAPVADGSAPASRLAAEGLLDAAFPRLLPGFAGGVRCLGRADAARLGDTGAGLRVASDGLAAASGSSEARGWTPRAAAPGEDG